MALLKIGAGSMLVGDAAAPLPAVVALQLFWLTRTYGSQ